MATYMKPASKLFDLPSRGSAELNLTDLMCPVCRGILIEPVTLPCAHSLCLRCLNGTIQHNSLSCPLCRVRVGSWLRTATKSDTLVNDGLWKFIKTRFSKEIQEKNDGKEVDLDSGFVSKSNKILSAAGEIRREYEVQLQLAEKEIKRRRDAERLASEALIRQIQAEEREQLAKDNAVAKNLAKRSITDRLKAKDKYIASKETQQSSGSYVHGNRNSSATVQTETFQVDSAKSEKRKSKDTTEWNSNIALISKLRAESYASDMKPGMSSLYKGNTEKYFLLKSDESQKLTKHHPLANKIGHQAAQSYMPKPGCSNSKIYGTQSKEELHVPSDVLNRKNKILGIEVCLAAGGDDQRIGSAESTGSHDSINIEIHHFKPIKAMPRTPLKVTPDGRQIDPKLIRVVPVLKRVQNTVPKPPTLMQLKRLSGCSYSAFKGKSKKVLRQEQCPAITNLVKEVADKGPSTLYLQNQQQQHTNPNKLSKSQISETVRRLDLSSEISYDGNKNYAKNINRIINGTKVSKKLILDEDVADTRAEWISLTTNGDNNPGKFKRRKHTSFNNDKEESAAKRNANYYSGDESATASCSVKHDAILFTDSRTVLDGSDDTIIPAIENIAERIKKRKMGGGRNHYHSAVTLKRHGVAEKRTISGTPRKSIHADEISIAKRMTPVPQKTRVKYVQKQDDDPNENIDSEMESVPDGDPSESIQAAELLNGRNLISVTRNAITCSGNKSRGNNKKATRNSARRKNNTDSNKTGTLTFYEEGDAEGVREQKRMERLLRQEKKDFELARRLQAKFDEMERISGRTRGSRRGGREAVPGGLNSKNIEQVLVGRTVRHAGIGIKDRLAKRLIVTEDERSAKLQTTKRRITRRRCV